MHLVLVSSLVPVENPSSGFDIANRAVLDGLRALGHRVSVIGYLQPGEALGGGWRHVSAWASWKSPTPRLAPQRNFAGWQRLFSIARPCLRQRCLKIGGRTQSKCCCRACSPSTDRSSIPCNCRAAFAPVFRNIRRSMSPITSRPILRSKMRRRRPDCWNGFCSSARPVFSNRSSGNCAQAASAIWTFAEADRFGFGYAVSDRAAVLPLVTRWELPESGVAGLPEHDLALIGTWSWKPNRIGLDWFLSKVVPHLPADMSIGIAGQLPGCARDFSSRSAFPRKGAGRPRLRRGRRSRPADQPRRHGCPAENHRDLRARHAVRRHARLLARHRRDPGNCSVADDPVEFARLLTEKVAQVAGRQSPAPVGRSLPSGAESQVARNAQAGPCRFGKARHSLPLSVSPKTDQLPLMKKKLQSITRICRA